MKKSRYLPVNLLGMAAFFIVLRIYLAEYRVSIILRSISRINQQWYIRYDLTPKIPDGNLPQ